MNICEKCKQQILSLEEFQKKLGSPYLMAISDKQFIEWLKGREKNE